jgi:hypothetical protein
MQIKMGRRLRNLQARRLFSMGMTRSLHRKPAVLRFLCIALLLAAAVTVFATGSSQARSDAHAGGVAHSASSKQASAKKSSSRGPSYLTGIGDEQGDMFTSQLWRQLHTKIVRFVTPYDTATREYNLLKAEGWIHAAEAAHQEILVAFYHSEYTATRNPSVATYKKDVAKFIKDFPHVRVYQAWDEANRGNEKGVFSSPSAEANAKYYQALKRDCHACTVIGLDVLDQDDIYPTLDYISEFKREIYRLKTVMPTIWGLHDYSDVNRLESWRTHDIVKALGGQVWLTETGGIVKFGGEFPNKNGSGLRRAAKVIKFTFKVAAENSQIKRLYLYDWTGGNSKTRFDAGLMNEHDKPRPGYVVVCRQLHAAKCNVKVVNN